MLKLKYIKNIHFLFQKKVSNIPRVKDLIRTNRVKTGQAKGSGTNLNRFHRRKRAAENGWIFAPGTSSTPLTDRV